jgi:protocatechuate 3,4-dioxygenase beta subunit
MPATDRRLLVSRLYLRGGNSPYSQIRDLWNCNATGVYSGVQAEGNGNDEDDSNLNATYLRGISKANCDGVVQFTTLFPGHYDGRTNHHHMIAHLNATVLPNNTLTGGTVPHITQLFWDQDSTFTLTHIK